MSRENAKELQAQGKHDEAEPLYREALRVDRETHGDRHPDTLISISNLGGLLHEKGDHAAAEPLFREALEGLRETLGSSRDPSMLAAISNLGTLLQEKGDLAIAEPLQREALEGWRETVGAQHPDTLFCLEKLETIVAMRKLQEDCAKTTLLLRNLQGASGKISPHS